MNAFSDDFEILIRDRRSKQKHVGARQAPCFEEVKSHGGLYTKKYGKSNRNFSPKFVSEYHRKLERERSVRELNSRKKRSSQSKKKRQQECELRANGFASSRKFCESKSRSLEVPRQGKSPTVNSQQKTRDFFKYTKSQSRKPIRSRNTVAHFEKLRTGIKNGLKTLQSQFQIYTSAFASIKSSEVEKDDDKEFLIQSRNKVTSLQEHIDKDLLAVNKASRPPRTSEEHEILDRVRSKLWDLEYQRLRATTRESMV